MKAREGGGVGGEGGELFTRRRNTAQQREQAWCVGLNIRTHERLHCKGHTNKNYGYMFARSFGCRRIGGQLRLLLWSSGDINEKIRLAIGANGQNKRNCNSAAPKTGLPSTTTTAQDHATYESFLKKLVPRT